MLALRLLSRRHTGAPYTRRTRHLLRTFTTDAQINAVLKQPPEFIRNFSIIAHIDHGKSTLADRLLAHAGNIPDKNLSISGEGAQTLDTLNVERERGITVKAQTATMIYTDPETKKGPYLLNLIDTPGHVDFSYEVARSLKASQGALLLVDASQGIQAQTIATYEAAFSEDLHVIPVLTKMDLATARPDEILSELESMFGITKDEVIFTSAKSGDGTEEIFREVVKQIPPPPVNVSDSDSDSNSDSSSSSSSAPSNGLKPARVLLIDSWHQRHRGVVSLVQVSDGDLCIGDKVSSLKSDLSHDIQDVGILRPEQHSTGILRAGQVGYIVAGMKSTREVVLGDTMYRISQNPRKSGIPDAQRSPIVPRDEIEAIAEFPQVKAMIYASLYPVNSSDLALLEDGIDKLCLNDQSVSAQKETSDALGLGFRCGFLGVLHMEVFRQRLEEDAGIDVLVTAPTVPYKAEMRDGSTLTISSPREFPQKNLVERYMQPMVTATLIAPEEYFKPVLAACDSAEGMREEVTWLGEDGKRAMVKYRFSMASIISDFFSRVKAASHGYASLDLEEAGYEEADVCKLEMLLNGKSVDALSLICDRSRSQKIGRDLCDKLKELVDRQNFEIIIQASVSGKPIARTRIPPYRKDVLSKSGKTVGGGDPTRKRKLLERQKAGKKRMKQVGTVTVPQEAFMAVLAAR